MITTHDAPRAAPVEEPRINPDPIALKAWARERGMGQNPWLAAYMAYEAEQLANLRDRVEALESRVRALESRPD